MQEGSSGERSRRCIPPRLIAYFAYSAVDIGGERFHKHSVHVFLGQGIKLEAPSRVSITIRLGEMSSAVWIL